MSGFPEGWTSCPLLSAVELHDSRRVPLNAAERAKRNGTFPYYGANGLVDHIDSYIFDGDFVLLAEDGGNFDKPERGVAYEASGQFWVNNHAHILRPRGDMPVRFLRYWLNAIDWMPYVGGTTRAKLTQAGMSQVTLPLPPSSEQLRIVAKLDSLTGCTARAQEELRRIPRLIQKYREAILSAAFSGELTKEWRQKEGVKVTWAKRNVGQIISTIIAGKNLRCEERPPRENEKGVVKVSAVTWGTFDPSAAKTLPSNFVPPDHTRIRAGDFLISRANTLELVGAVVIVDHSPGNLFLSDKILRLEMQDIHKRWLLWFLRSPVGRFAIEESATGNQLSMRNLSQAALLKIVLPWPEDSERQEIVHRIETAFAWLDRVAAEHANASHLLPKLDQAILAKAFRGELVPQDPNDEPVELNAPPAAEGHTRRGRSTRKAVTGFPQGDDHLRDKRKQRRGQF